MYLEIHRVRRSEPVGWHGLGKEEQRSKKSPGSLGERKAKKNLPAGRKRRGLGVCAPERSHTGSFMVRGF